MKRVLKLVGLGHWIYCGMMVAYAGIHTTFASFWLAAGSFWMLLSVFSERCLSLLRYPLRIGGLIFLIQEFRIFRSGYKSPEKSADYAIVLGAQVKGCRPSRSLYRRILAAAQYAKVNPCCQIIASGGRGPGEDISEAECIRETLISMGIDKERILLEDQSVNTRQNLTYSLKLGGKESRYVIVTNRFHLFRAMAVGRDLGMEHISGLGAASEPVLRLNYYVREFFAWVFYIIMKWREKI